ncbi:MAG: hypothetical protein AB1585_03630 [Thermodesulfobacteriota bacterium]
MFNLKILFSVLFVILGLVMVIPVAQAERQEVEGIGCASNMVTTMHNNPGQIYIGTWEGKGIFRSTHKNKINDNNTFHQVGITKGSPALGGYFWHGYSKSLSQNGDFAIWEISGNNKDGSSSKLIYGTGKYKDAKGEMKHKVITRGRPVVENTDQVCQQSVGWIEFAASTSATSSSPTNKPIRDFKEIAGKWEGKVDGPGWSTKMTVIFNEDGTGDVFVPQDSSIFIFSEKGRFPMERKLVDGKIRTKNLLSGSTGTNTLYEEGGKRFLKSQTDDGAQSGVFEQVK